jgi:hypothetical protein
MAFAWLNIHAVTFWSAPTAQKPLAFEKVANDNRMGLTIPRDQCFSVFSLTGERTRATLYGVIDAILI